MIIILLLFKILIAGFVDIDEENSNIRKEGEYYGLDSLFDCASFIAQPICLAVLFYMGYSEQAPTGAQLYSAKMAIVVCMSLIPASLMWIGSVFMLLFYPKDRKTDKDSINDVISAKKLKERQKITL